MGCPIRPNSQGMPPGASVKSEFKMRIIETADSNGRLIFCPYVWLNSGERKIASYTRLSWSGASRFCVKAEAAAWMTESGGVSEMNRLQSLRAINLAVPG